MSVLLPILEEITYFYYTTKNLLLQSCTKHTTHNRLCTNSGASSCKGGLLCFWRVLRQRLPPKDAPTSAEIGQFTLHHISWLLHCPSCDVTVLLLAKPSNFRVIFQYALYLHFIDSGGFSWTYMALDGKNVNMIRNVSNCKVTTNSCSGS